MALSTLHVALRSLHKDSRLVASGALTLAVGIGATTAMFGVRVAVGATRQQLVRLVLRDGARPSAVGLVCGLVGAVVVARGLRGVLFGISPLDAVSFITAPAVLLPATLLVCVIPAVRAARVDPVTVLKSE